MKYKWDKKYLYWGITAFCVIAAALLFNAVFITGTLRVGNVFSGILSALKPVVYGFAIAYLLNPVENFFEKNVCMRFAMYRHRKKDPNHEMGNETMIKSRKRSRAMGVTLAMITALLIVIGIIMIIIPQLITTVQKLINNVPGYISSATEWANEKLADYPEVSEWITNTLNDIYDQLQKWVTDTLMPQMTDIIVNISNGVFAVIQTFSNVFFGIVIAVYFLYGKELFAAQLKKLLYSLFSAKYANAVIGNMRGVHKTFGGFLSGKIIDSLLIMLIFMVILSVFRFPYAMLCAVVLGVFNIIPVFGPIIGAVPCAFLILLEDPLYCLYFIVVVIVVQQLDGNVIGPRILGESTGLSSFWIIFALLVGQGLFGFVGLIIGIPLFAVIYSFVRAKVGGRLTKKGLPDDSNVYRKVAYVDEESGELITLYEMNKSEQIKAEQKRLEQQTRHGHLRRRLMKRRHRKKERDDG